jgi:hypothetical protein
MLEFFLAELRRFRVAAALYGLANLIAVAVLQQIADVPNGPIGLHVIMLGFFMLSGLALAVFQFGSYRQTSRWIWLQHRPVHRARILAALVLAAVVLVAVGVALPLCTALLLLDHYRITVVDARHYAGAAYLALSALIAWLAGGYIMLHRSRWVFVIFALPVWLAMRYATASTVLELALACAAILLVLLYTVFRPSRSAADDAAATAATALPLQICLYVALVWGGSMAYQAGLMATGTHPEMRQFPPAGSFAEARRLVVKDALLAGLADSGDPRAAAWRAALDPRAVASFRWVVYQYGVPGVMTTRGMTRFVDGDMVWTFSHDRMQYRGANVRSRADLGWFGAGGSGSSEPFDAVPVGDGDNRSGRWMFDSHNLYQVDGPGLRLQHVLRVEGGEQLGGRVAVLGQRTLVVTNRRLVVLDRGAKVTATDVKLPLPYGDLEHVQAAQVPDGTLATFVYGHRQADGSPASQQVTYFVDRSGRVQEVGRRALAHDFPPLFEHRAWWVSPALDALVMLPDLLIDDGTVPDYGLERFAPLLQPRPAVAWTAALAAALLAGAGAAWWTRRTSVGSTARAAWCLACVLLGVPALLSLMILQPRTRAEAVARVATMATSR